jgi:hypothetical protein
MRPGSSKASTRNLSRGCRKSYALKAVCFVLYQGTTLVGPLMNEKRIGLQPLLERMRPETLCLERIPGRKKGPGAKARSFVGLLYGPTKSRALIQSIRAVNREKIAHSGDLNRSPAVLRQPLKALRYAGTIQKGRLAPAALRSRENYSNQHRPGESAAASSSGRAPAMPGRWWPTLHRKKAE